MLLLVLLWYSTILVFWFFATLGPMQSILNDAHQVYMYQWDLYIPFPKQIVLISIDFQFKSSKIYSIVPLK